MTTSATEPKAAAVIAKSPGGRVMFIRDGSDVWSFPSANVEDGEDAAQCAWRGFYTATGYRLGGLKPLMHWLKGDMQFFIAEVEEFVPARGDFMWADPAAVLEEAE